MNEDLFDVSASEVAGGEAEGRGGIGKISDEAEGGADIPAVPDSPAEDGAPAVGYRETQKVYAARYGMSLRSIKLWISEGREADPPFPPPLDDAEAMLSWWHKVKHNRVPPRLLVAAETAAAARKAATAVAAPEPVPAPPAEIAAPSTPPPAQPAKQTTNLAIGFAASLERVRVAEAEAHGHYIAALTEQDVALRNEAKIERLRKTWSDLSEQLRFLEKAAPEVLAKSGEMITRADVRRLLSTLHGPIVAGVRSLFRKVRAKAGLNATLDDLEKLYTAEAERLFTGLYNSDFAPE